jgi:hypothetical protein
VGFHVTIREGDRQLLKALRSNPSEVFGRPYVGYLLFLVGGNDTAALDWLRSHLVSLDSLTGHHVAYGIFAERVPVQLFTERVPVQLEVPSYYDDLPQHRFLGEVSLSDVRRIDSYIKSGCVGRIANGDHLAAMTYATDRVARAFGVLDHLPCILVLDAFPSDEVDVVELSSDQLPELLPLLRTAIHRLTQDPAFTGAIEALELLGEIRQLIDARVNDLREQRATISGIPVVSDLADRIRQEFLGMEGSIRSGSHRDCRGYFETLRKYAGDEVPSDLDESKGQRVVGYAKTLRALAHFSAVPWPLPEPQERQLREVLSQHVSRLLPDLPGSSDIRREDLLRFRELLIQRQSSLVQEIMESLPSEEVVLSRAQSIYTMRRLEAEKRMETVTAEIESLRAEATAALELFSSESAPSLRRIVSKVAKEKKLKLVGASVVDKATAYAGKLFDPETLLKILAGAARASG